jgi:glycosyltransferase involved in cell wall biosynthesis
MNIGVETTAISGAQSDNGDKSGVYRYFLNLVKALSHLLGPKDQLFLYDTYRFALKNLSSDLFSVLANQNVYTPTINPPRPFKFEYTRVDDMPVIRWFSKRLDKFLVAPITERYAYSAFVKKINNNLTKNQIDIFHVSETVYFETPRTKQVATVCDLIPIIFPEFQREETVKIHLRRLRYLKNNSDGVIVISENTKKDLINMLHFNPDKIYVTHLAADESFHPLSKDSVISVLEVFKEKQLEYKNYIMYYGTIEPRKNLGILLKAYRDLRRNGLYNGKLLLIGGKGWGKALESLKSFIRENMMQKDIIYSNFLADDLLNHLVNGAQMVVYPSIYEGFGLPIVEVMQAGCPVITTNVSSIPEVSGKAALLFAPGDLNKLKEHMLAVINNPNLEKNLVQKGLKQAKLFTWKKTAEQTLQIYEKIIKAD